MTTTRSIFLIFGKSIFTAYEAYEVILPMLNSSTATSINETSTLKQILLQLIQNDNLHYTQLAATNIFVLFNRPIAIDNSDLIELRDFKLNRSCKKFRISFRDVSPEHDFEIFQDDFTDMLNLSDKKTEKEEAYEEKSVWYQSKIFVKGFNDVLVNNNSIWT